METLLEFAKYKKVKKTLLEWSKENVKQKNESIRKQTQHIYEEIINHKGIFVLPPQKPYREFSL